jgi:glycosyltransferase involved in cell wall biosynthesis
VLGDPELHRRVADAGRRRARAYAWEGVAARFADLYAAVRAGALAGAR